MNSFPIQRITLSDFRRIAGTRDIPLDAPIVLIHGPNGTGKTSVLSALELALTGAIKSMERQSDRYRAHLPFYGQPYATVRAEVSADLRAPASSPPLTVNGSRLEGTPALPAPIADFYSERCYLDQSSLGRLLDLYQARESSKQSALEKFVNELLGLEKLDALRDGLDDAGDIRRLKRLVPNLDTVWDEVRYSTDRLAEATQDLDEARRRSARARQSLQDHLRDASDDGIEELTDPQLLDHARRLADAWSSTTDASEATRSLEQLLALGGRIAASERLNSGSPSEDPDLDSLVRGQLEEWNHLEEPRLLHFAKQVAALGVSASGATRESLIRAISEVDSKIEAEAIAHKELQEVVDQLQAARADEKESKAALATLRHDSASLVEALTLIQGNLDGDTCPVCERDFAEVGSQPLTEHLSVKLRTLTRHADQVADMTSRRIEAAERIRRLESKHSLLTKRAEGGPSISELAERREELGVLETKSDSMRLIEERGSSLRARVRALQERDESEKSRASERSEISQALDIHESEYEVSIDRERSTANERVSLLIELARVQSSELQEKSQHAATLRANSERLADAISGEAQAVARVAEIAARRRTSDSILTEARRRQGVAKQVHAAAAEARASIVQRVFTRSLNRVWRDVFERLAPDERFIPSFGVPSTTRKTFDIHLETVQTDGQSAGPPQMMLSAGNLNTAALSLFLALHLVAEPTMPCLVLDDPVQAMDEVHVAQFAGLMRMLSKQHGRQVILAVHERELFDYLSLELSPAFDGDELITVELAAESTHVRRHVWQPDALTA